MKKFRFLFKPLLFIFNLIFATWLVLKIEKLQPSDFGRHKKMFEPAPVQDVESLNKQKIRQLLEDYKGGKLNDKQLESELLKLSGK